MGKERIVIEEGLWKIQKKFYGWPFWVTMVNFTTEFDTAMAKLGWKEIKKKLKEGE